jgi:UDP-N-acetylglucosamine--N-acetylmuramyl-(pentapeptide) pyrophosphoryl-undecaprenol N-acetylglucosamine transferase
LKPERKTLFIFGGSRGSWNINKAVMDNLPALLEQIQVIHISGTLTWPQVEEFAATLSAEQRQWYRPYPYLHERMGIAFRAADLALARAGASMLGEGPAFGLPSIMVPLTFAWRYQKVNADYLTEHGAALQSTDELLPDEIVSLVLDLLNDEGRFRQMQEAAQSLDKPNASAQLAQVIAQTGQYQGGAA